MTENEVQQHVQIAGPFKNCHLMRNNSGALKDATGRLVRYGLGNVSKEHNDKMKSSDLIGMTQVTITPEMVGKTLAVITAAEIKESNWKYTGTKREVAQKNFIDWLTKRGGIAGFVNSVDGFNAMIDDYVEGLKR